LREDLMTDHDAVPPSQTPPSKPAAAETVPETPPARRARDLMRGLDRASLATALPAGSTALPSAAGWPYASLVLVATAPDGAPLLLVSDLSQHAKNMAADARVSLLFDGTVGLDEPLTGSRVSVLGRADRRDEPALLQRFCARHPSAELYAGFTDFHIYRIAVERAHLVAGFGRIHWVEAADLLPPGVDALADAEASIVQHMNKDHADVVRLYANALLGRPGEGWVMTGVDAEGADLRCGGAVARLDFSVKVLDSEGARQELVRLAAEARRRAG
jgi:putative heme iron utilization protein